MDALELLKLRRETSTKNDGHAIWLYVDSGANMGVVGGGMITALQDAGLLGFLDGVVGSSVGAYVAAYGMTKAVCIIIATFVARQPKRSEDQRAA